MAQRPRARRSSSPSGGARRSSGGSSRSSGGGRRPSGGSRGSSGGSRGSSGGSRAGGRGRTAGRGRGGGGSSNATAIGVGVVLLIGVVAIIMISGNKKKKPTTNYVTEELTSDSQVDKTEQGPKQPERPPPPEISPEILQDAKDVVAEAKIEAGKGDALYDEAMAAKRAGDESTWQEKLAEAREHYVNIRDMWNNRIEEPIMNELPMGCQWEADEVANHWIGKEAGKITKMLSKLGMITKQTRMK